MNALSWTQWEFAEKLRENLEQIWIVFLLVFLRMQTSLLKFHASVASNFCETNFCRFQSISLCCLKFCFRARIVLYIKFSVASGCLQPPFLMSFKEQKYLLNEPSVSSEIFTVLKLIIGLLNNCTKTLLQLGNLKLIFWIEFATEWFFQKVVLLANVKLTLCCCHCVVRARPRK